MSTQQEAASTLDELVVTDALVELKAARIVCERLKSSGPPPYSLCEARLTQAEFEWLLKWARQVTASRFREEAPQFNGAALLTLALMTEWNRRESDGDAVYQGIPALFGVAATRDALFQSNGNARQLLRDVLRIAAVATSDCLLRHAYESRDETKQRWYLTVQLQFGFCHQQVPRVTDWLRGLPPTEAMQRLLLLNGPQRSRSFQKLMATLRHYRRDFLTELAARRELERNAWILPDWIPELLKAARSDRPAVVSAEGIEDEPAITERVTVEWTPELGPIARLKLAEIRSSVELSSDQYHLHADKVLLATWIAQPAFSTAEPVEFRVDAERVDLKLDRPSLVISLEDENENQIAIESLEIWDPSADVQALLIGVSHEQEREEWRAGRDVAVLARRGYTPSLPADEWYLSGYDTQYERKWHRYRSAPAKLAMFDPQGRLAWEAIAMPIPQWAQGVEAEIVPEQQPLALGNDFRVRIRTPKSVSVEWVVLNGSPVAFDNVKGLTSKISLHADLAIFGCRLRFGLERDGSRQIHHMTIPVKCVGLARQNASGSWRIHPPRELLTTYEAQRGIFRVFTDESDLLFEGYEVLGRRNSRPRGLMHVLATGASLQLASEPFNVDDRLHRLVAGVVDFGFVLRLHRPTTWGGTLRLELQRPLVPTPEHSLLMWSDREGLHQVTWDQIRVTGENVWSFDCPSAIEPHGLLVALVYEGYRLGFAWDWKSKWSRFFFAARDDYSGMSPSEFLALIRWLRLPGLIESGHVRRRPILEEYAHAQPAALLTVALFDQGLETLPGNLGLHFDTSVQATNSFDAIVRQILFDIPLSDAQAIEIDDSFAQNTGNNSRHLFVERMFLAHPILAARVVRRAWLPRIPEGTRAAWQQWFSSQRYRLMGFDERPSPHDYSTRIEQLRLDAARTLSEDSRRPIDEFFIHGGIVEPATSVALHDKRIWPHEKRNILIALGSAAFRQYLTLHLLAGLEQQI